MRPGRRLEAALAAALAAALLSAAAAAGEETAPRFGAIEGEKGPYLVGEVTRGDVLTHFPAWRDTALAYVPDMSVVAALGQVARPVEIDVVLGTWCGDSRREVPRFWKILDLAANPRLQLRMFAVGRKDDAAGMDLTGKLGLPRDLRAHYDVTLVPTFIFRSEGVELGRIVETPRASLEADAAAILATEAAPAEGGGWH